MDEEDINIDNGEPMIWVAVISIFSFLVGMGMVAYHFAEAIL